MFEILKAIIVLCVFALMVNIILFAIIQIFIWICCFIIDIFDRFRETKLFKIGR